MSWSKGKQDKSRIIRGLYFVIFLPSFGHGDYSMRMVACPTNRRFFGGKLESNKRLIRCPALDMDQIYSLAVFLVKGVKVEFEEAG